MDEEGLVFNNFHVLGGHGRVRTSPNINFVQTRFTLYEQNTTKWVVLESRYSSLASVTAEQYKHKIMNNMIVKVKYVLRIKTVEICWCCVFDSQCNVLDWLLIENITLHCCSIFRASQAFIVIAKNVVRMVEKKTTRKDDEIYTLECDQCKFWPENYQRNHRR